MYKREPVISIDLASPVPVYRQIVDALRHELVAGTLAPGDSLPPVRQLALDLCVHFNTVAQAYRTLADEGWLDLKRGRGATVVERAAAPPAGAEQLDNARRKLRELIALFRAEGMPEKDIASELRQIAKGLK